MKILYIAKIDGCSIKEDYLCDMLFHGFRSLFGADVVDVNRNTTMYNDLDPNYRRLYGNGFTIWKTLDSTLEIDRTDIESKIKNIFFNLIIYGHANRTLKYIDIVKSTYNKNKVILFDGEDQQRFRTRQTTPINILELGFPIFKRELNMEINGIFPISFCIPKEKIYHGNIQKTKNFATNTMNKRNRIFNKEEDYYNEYRNSYFGTTKKKGGWDCCRHYEIMMNKCIPYFENIQNMPHLTMVHFPKKLVQEAMNSININKIDDNIYLDFQQKIFNHMLQHNTTEAMAKYVLNTVEGLCKLQ